MAAAPAADPGLTKQVFVCNRGIDSPAARPQPPSATARRAARAFASRGFAAASVREIVGPIGMLPGSLYCHFATKEALLVAVYQEGVERISAAVDAAVAPLAEPWARLEAGCIAHLASLLDQTDYSQVVIRGRRATRRRSPTSWSRCATATRRAGQR